MAGPNIIVSVLGDGSKFSKSMDAVGKTGNKLGSVMKGVALGVGAVAVAGTALIGKVLADSFKAVAEIERLNAQTSAALESTGNAAGRSMDQILAHADSLERLTGVEAESIQTGQNMLLTFTNIKGTRFDEATQSALDLSVAMGKDMASSATLVGKALNDPIKGIGALSKVGVQLTESQKASIEQMVKMGDVAGAQGIILGELNTQFGGSAEAFGNTFLGSVEKVKNSFGTLGESVVQGFLPVATTALNKVNDLFLRIADSPAFAAIVAGISSFVLGLFDGSAAASTFGQAFSVVMAFLNPFGLVLQALAPLLPGLASQFVTLAQSVGGALATALPTVTATLQLLVGALSGVLAAVLPVIIQLVTQLADVFAQLLPQLLPIVNLVAGILVQAFAVLAPVIGQVADIVGTLISIAIAALMPVLSQIIALLGPLLQAFRPIIDVVLGLVTDALGPLLGVFGQLIGAILPPIIKLLAALLTPILGLIAPLVKLLTPALQFVGTVLGAVAGFVAKAISAFVGLVTGSKNTQKQVRQVWDSVLGFFRGIPDAIGRVFAGAGRWLYSAGRNVVEGLLNGVKSLGSTVGKFFLDLLPDWIVGPFKSALGIASPSRLFDWFGQMIPAGLVRGVRKGTGAVMGASKGMASAFTSSFRPGFGSGSAAFEGGGTFGSRSLIVNVSGGIGTSAEIGRQVVEAIEEYERLNGGQR